MYSELITHIGDEDYHFHIGIFSFETLMMFQAFIALYTHRPLNKANLKGLNLNSINFS